MGPISLGLGHNVISVRPITQTGETDFGNGLTRELLRQSWWDRFALSIGPKHYGREAESLHCNLGGTDRSSRLDRNVTKGNREITIPSR